jgi:hypothetical protein
MDPITTVSSKRPIPITIMCVIGAFGPVLIARLLLSDVSRSVGDWYQVYLVAAILVGTVCLIGFWKMKRWAFYLYLTVAALNLIGTIYTGWWRIPPFVVAAITIAIFGSYFKRMT